MPQDAGSTRSEGVEVFWRPGCPYCAALRRTLRRRRIPATWRNIWTDDQARALVCAANGGNETVPTVRVGERTLTNPSWSELAPVLGHGLPPGQPPAHGRRGPRRALSWFPVLAFVLLSVTWEWAGDDGMSWAADGLALVAWWLTRPLRR